MSAGKEAQVVKHLDVCDSTKDKDLPCLLDPIKNITFEQDSSDVSKEKL